MTDPTPAQPPDEPKTELARKLMDYRASPEGIADRAQLPEGTPRTEMKCERCGGFSSTRVCWSCSQRVDAIDHAELLALRQLCAAAYQLAGLVGAPVRFLDALGKAANGEVGNAETLLPVDLTECDEFVALRQSVERLEKRNAVYAACMNTGGVEGLRSRIDDLQKECRFLLDRSVRGDSLHRKVCNAVELLNIGNDIKASLVLRQSLVDWADSEAALRPAVYSVLRGVRAVPNRNDGTCELCKEPHDKPCERDDCYLRPPNWGTSKEK